MSKLIAITVAAALAASSANAQSFGGVSSWSVGEDVSSEKASSDRLSMFETMLMLVGFDDQLKEPNWLDGASSAAYSSADAGPADQCEDEKAADAGESESEEEQALIAGEPEPMFFIF